MNHNAYMTGILLYKTPTPYTKQNTYGSTHCVAYKVNFVGLSEDEQQIVGTRCGMTAYDQQRVEEYRLYKSYIREGCQSPFTQAQKLLLQNVLERCLYNKTMIAQYFFGDVIWPEEGVVNWRV